MDLILTNESLEKDFISNHVIFDQADNRQASLLYLHNTRSILCGRILLVLVKYNRKWLSGGFTNYKETMYSRTKPGTQICSAYISRRCGRIPGRTRRYDADHPTCLFRAGEWRIWIFCVFHDCTVFNSSAIKAL